MQFSTYFKAAPLIRPILNIGCLMDIPTGRIVKGKKGESIVNGGVAYLTGIIGKGNTFKSMLGNFMLLSILNRYGSSNAVVYDTEASASLARLKQLTTHLSPLNQSDLESSDRLFLTDNTVMSGDEFFDQLKLMAEEKLKVKSNLRNAPFFGDQGESLTTVVPTINFIDSFSMFSTAKVQKIYDDTKLGDSSANVDALRAAAHKTQMLMQVPTLTGKSGVYMLFSGHVGKQHQLDPYSPPDKKLTFLKNASIKNVPEKFTFLTNNLWYVYQANVLNNKTTKAAEYPVSGSDQKEGDTDLMVITVQNLRGKYGPTGLPFDIVLSQREGILVGLTQFHYLKSHGKYGINGNDRSYSLDMYPDLALSRTTIRSKIQESAELQRALEISTDLHQMASLWEDPENVFCTPKELYEGIIEQGYDWKTLLNTRSYWVFEEDEKDLPPYLSTMDLLRMRKGIYQPHWLKKK